MDLMVKFTVLAAEFEWTTSDAFAVVDRLRNCTVYRHLHFPRKLVITGEYSFDQICEVLPAKTYGYQVIAGLSRLPFPISY